MGPAPPPSVTLSSQPTGELGSRAERSTTTVDDPTEPDPGNAGGGSHEERTDGPVRFALLAAACGDDDSAEAELSDGGSVTLMTHDSFVVSDGVLEAFTAETEFP